MFLNSGSRESSNHLGSEADEVHDFDHRIKEIKAPIENQYEQRQMFIRAAPPRREDNTCFRCGNQIEEEHIKKFPQSNICGNCYNMLVAKKKNGHRDLARSP